MGALQPLRVFLVPLRKTFARKHGEEPGLGWFDPGLEVGPCSSEIDALISEARSTLVH